METQSDFDLLRLARQFDLPALAAIYDRYNQALYYYALRLLGDTNLAEDCIAETFSRLLKAFRAGQGPQDNLKAYIYRSAHNWITDHYRREPIPLLELSDELPEPENDDPGDQAEAHILQQHVRTALRLLTPDQRQVIMLRFIEGWEIAEIAVSIDKPVGSVKALQHRAIIALQKLLLDEEIGIIYEPER